MSLAIMWGQSAKTGRKAAHSIIGLLGISTILTIASLLGDCWIIQTPGQMRGAA